jgi:uncharacterized protein (DUF111 family)
VTQGITKKGRPEFLFFVDTPDEQVEALGSFMASELGTLGIRVIETRHIRFDYRIIEVLLKESRTEHPLEVVVQVKEIRNNKGRIVSVKADYEDLKMAVTQFQQVGLELSFVALKGLAEQTVLGRADLSIGGIQAKYPGEK